jgi:hypothetical protein
MRVTSTDIKLIMDGCTTDSTTIDAFITAGEQVIDRIFAASNPYTDAELKEIERWFVAHMIASTVFRTTSDEKVGDASVTYTGKWGKNLDSTPYGQMVQIIDTSGMITGTLGANATIYTIKSFDK